MEKLSKEQALESLQGKWECENDILEINGIITLDKGEQFELMWNENIDKWVIPVGISTPQLSINEDGKLLYFLRENGPFAQISLLYSRII